MKKIFLFAFICCVCGGAFGADKLKSKKGDIPTVLGGIVRSDKWVVKRNPPREEFTGNVSYKNPYYEVKADWALFERNAGLFSAKGNVWGKKIWSDDAITEMFCHTALYDRKKSIAQGYPKEGEFVRIFHFEPDHGQWKSTARKVLFDENAQRVDLIREVRVISDKNNALADKISYYYKGDSFEFSGNPVIWGTYREYDFAVTGKKAKSENFFDNLEVKEKVRGWVKGKDGVLTATQMPKS